MSTLDPAPVFDAALSMSEPLRAQLAEQVFLSLAPPQKFSDAEWCDELQRRIAEVEAGTAETLSFEEAITELRARRDLREKR